jgi:hypothetical protein
VRALAVVLALAICTESPASPSLNPRAALEEGKLAYQRSDFAHVEKTIAPILYPTPELDGEALIEGRRLLGLAYFFEKKEDKAKQEFVLILQKRPDYELDPVVEPVKAVAFFNKVRTEQAELLAASRKRQQEEDEKARIDAERKRIADRAKAERVYVEKQVIRRSRLVAMLPFGIGQVQNGQRGKAIAFGVSEAVLGGLSLATWISIREVFPGFKVDATQERLKDTLVGLQIGAGVAFWAVVIWGIIDAQVKLVPETVILRDLDKKPQKKASTKLLIAPMVAPGLYGLGVGGTF